LLVDNKNEIGDATSSPVRLLGPVVDFDLEPGERRSGISVEFLTSAAPGSYDVQVTGACATPDTRIVDGHLNVVIGDEGPRIWGFSEELSQVSAAD
jgi:hypothetical protein